MSQGYYDGRYGYIPNNFGAKYAVNGYWGQGGGFPLQGMPQCPPNGGMDQAVRMMLTGVMPKSCQSPIYFQGNNEPCSGGGGMYPQSRGGGFEPLFRLSDDMNLGESAPPVRATAINPTPISHSSKSSAPIHSAVSKTPAKINDDPVAKALNEARAQVEKNKSLQNVLYDENGKPYVVVDKWNSQAKSGKKYANDCLSRIVCNVRPDLKPYSKEWYNETQKIMNSNNSIYNSGRPPVPGGGKINSLLKTGERVYLA